MSQNSSEESLKKRIQELEAEVTERERDLDRFRKELRTANSKLEGLIAQMRAELNVAHAIQKKLVPTDLPHIPGFEFSSKFVSSPVSGGDYYDIFEHEDRFRFGVILASSSGYMMSALLLSVMLRMTGQMEARRGSEPDKVVERLIADLAENMEEGDSVDLIYTLFDRKSYEMSYTNMGENVALLQTFGTGELKMLESSGDALTKTQKGPISKHQLMLSPRDRLIFCSRGILQARHLNGEEFGPQRLVKAILESPSQGVHELRNNILFQVEQFTAGSESQRDRTVLVIEVKDRVIKLAKK